MKHVDWSYGYIAKSVVINGKYKETRNGDVLSTFGNTFEHSMEYGFPILTTKKVSINNVLSELLWFASGSTNIRFLLERKCNIWNDDAYNYYNKLIDENSVLDKQAFIEKIKADTAFANVFGDLQGIYGKYWSMLEYILDGIKKDMYGRRHLLVSWDNISSQFAALPPCHYAMQFYVDPIRKEDAIDLLEYQGIEYDEIPEYAISMLWNQRSVDVALGLPYNISSYGLLLHIVAAYLGMIPNKLIGHLGDTHIYTQHIDQLVEQINQHTYSLPQLKISPDINFTKPFSNVITQMIDHPEPIVLHNYMYSKEYKYELFTKTKPKQ